MYSETKKITPGAERGQNQWGRSLGSWQNLRTQCETDVNKDFVF
jgi:hypothetical protein